MVYFRWVCIGVAAVVAVSIGGLLLQAVFDRQPAAPPNIAPVRFHCVPIETGPGPAVTVLGLNDKGSMVGRRGPVERSRACVVIRTKSGFRLLDLNSLLPPGSEWQLGEAAGINNAGQICGTAHRKELDGDSPRIFRAMIVPGSPPRLENFTLLSDDAGKHVAGKATGINSHGDVTGWHDPHSEAGVTNDLRESRRCFVWSAGESGCLQDVGEPPGGLGTGMTGPNDAGQFICGGLDGYDYRYEPGRPEAQRWTRLSSPAGERKMTAGNAINSAGDVVGWGITETAVRLHPERAMRFTDASGLEELGTLGGLSSMALDINDAGYVVGQSLDGRSDAQAFLFHPSFGMTALDDAIDAPSVHLVQAVRISRRGKRGIGHIVALDRNSQLFLLTAAH